MLKIQKMTKGNINKLKKAKELIKEILKSQVKLSSMSKNYLLDIKYLLADRIQYHEEN